MNDEASRMQLEQQINESAVITLAVNFYLRADRRNSAEFIKTHCI